MRNIISKIRSLFNRFIKTIKPKGLIWVALGALLFSLLYIFWFNKEEAEFAAAVELGKFTYTLSLSILASFIFYFITVHYPSIIKREEYIHTVDALISNLIFMVNHILLKRIKDSCDCDFNETYPTEEEWELLSTTSREDNVKWAMVLNDFVSQIKPTLNQIKTVSHLFPGLDKIIYDILRTNLFARENELTDIVLSGNEHDIKVFRALDIKYFLHSFRSLHQYYKEHIRPEYYKQ